MLYVILLFYYRYMKHWSESNAVAHHRELLGQLGEFEEEDAEVEQIVIPDEGEMVEDAQTALALDFLLHIVTGEEVMTAHTHREYHLLCALETPCPDTAL